MRHMFAEMDSDSSNNVDVNEWIAFVTKKFVEFRQLRMNWSKSTLTCDCTKPCSWGDSELQNWFNSIMRNVEVGDDGCTLAHFACAPSFTSLMHRRHTSCWVCVRARGIAVKANRNTPTPPPTLTVPLLQGPCQVRKFLTNLTRKEEARKVAEQRHAR